MESDAAPELALLAIIIALFVAIYVAWRISRRVHFGFIGRRIGERSLPVRAIRALFYLILAVALAPITFGIALGVMAGAGLFGP